ncbi:MAG TPA: DUF302 domain-containing protein [Gaiellaceae bacterium]|nr:DUF302 domain-containing protein [Gaiellaceae bacterium]
MPASTDTTYTLSGTTSLSFDDAVARVRETLKDEGFGVLTEIDVQATLQEKLGEQVEPYVILGACNPPYAHRALGIEPELGTLLPCNVVVYTQQDGATRVSAADPVAMLGIVGRTDLDPIAAEIREKVERAVSKVWEA